MEKVWMFGILFVMLSLSFADVYTDKIDALENQLRTQEIKMIIMQDNLNAQMQIENNKTRVQLVQTELSIKANNDKSNLNMMNDITQFIKAQNTDMLYKLTISVILVSMAIVSASVLIRVW